MSAFTLLKASANCCRPSCVASRSAPSEETPSCRAYERPNAELRGTTPSPGLVTFHHSAAFLIAGSLQGSHWGSHLPPTETYVTLGLRLPWLLFQFTIRA